MWKMLKTYYVIFWKNYHKGENEMIAVFISVLVVIGLFIVLGFTDEDWKLNAKQILSLFGFAIAIIGCIKTVPTGSTGIVTTFGRIENVSLDAGIHFMEPWKKVIKMDNRTQKQAIDMQCFSSDIQEVSVIYTVNYQINKSNAQEIYRTIGTEYFDKIVMPKTLEAVKSVFAKYTAEDLIASRAALSKEIEAILVPDLAEQNIQITSTSIENIDFTDAFTNAVEAKQVAEQNKLKAQTEQAQATLEAQAAAERQVIQAKADADASILAAQADAEVAKISADSSLYQGEKEATILQRVGEQLEKYPNLTKYKYYEKWDGKLPETVLGESDVLLNID